MQREHELISDSKRKWLVNAVLLPLVSRWDEVSRHYGIGVDSILSVFEDLVIEPDADLTDEHLSHIRKMTALHLRSYRDQEISLQSYGYEEADIQTLMSRVQAETATLDSGNIGNEFGQWQVAREDWVLLKSRKMHD